MIALGTDILQIERIAAVMECRGGYHLLLSLADGQDYVVAFAALVP